MWVLPVFDRGGGRVYAFSIVLPGRKEGPRILVTCDFEDGESATRYCQPGEAPTLTKPTPGFRGSSHKTDVNLHHYSWNNGDPRVKSIHVHPTSFV